MKLLIIGHMQHGKDTVAEMIEEWFGLTFKSSSLAAFEIFIYDIFKEKYRYTTPEECFEKRGDHRAELKELISNYNKDDRARLAKDILKENDIYVGMRDDREVDKCIEDNVFDYIIGVYNPRLPNEPRDSFDIDIWKKSHFIIPNAGTLEELDHRVFVIMSKILR